MLLQLLQVHKPQPGVAEEEAAAAGVGAAEAVAEPQPEPLPGSAAAALALWNVQFHPWPCGRVPRLPGRGWGIVSCSTLWMDGEPNCV